VREEVLRIIKNQRDAYLRGAVTTRTDRTPRRGLDVILSDNSKSYSAENLLCKVFSHLGLRGNATLCTDEVARNGAQLRTSAEVSEAAPCIQSKLPPALP